MITTINNKHKKLNVPNKREQNQTCLDSAEREGLRPKGNVPNLRFPEFQGEWISKTIGDIAPLQRGFDLPTRQICNGKIPVVYSNGIMNHHSSYKCVAPGLVTGRSGTIGKFTYIEDGYYWPHNTSLWVTDFHDNNPKFIYYLYQTIHIEQYSTGSGVPTLNRNNVHRHKTFIPKLKEQNKIAAFLSLLDERISTQSKIIEDLKKLKSAIIEIEYTPNTKTTSPIGDVIEQISKRNKNNAIQNVLSVSNRQGFIKQSDQFENRNVASEDTSNYKIVEKNDFAFNPARINVGSIARLTTFEKGIVSPMYICFRTQENVAPEYIDYFFESKHFYCEIQKRLEGSVRQCLSFEGLCNIPFSLPSLEMQQRIGKRLFILGQKIKTETDLLELLNKQKQYLLRQMFILTFGGAGAASVKYIMHRATYCFQEQNPPMLASLHKCP